MSRRYLIGGPSNSGKSTFTLSLAKRLTEANGLSVETIEFDVWSGSYPAFEGRIAFEDRPKRFGLDWDWRTPLDACIARFNCSDADIVFGDLPGVLDEAIAHMIDASDADSGIIVSRTLEGLAEWSDAFHEKHVPVSLKAVTFEGNAPFVLTGLDRTIDAEREGVIAIADLLTERLRT